MCGIAGAVGVAEPQRLLDPMVRCLRHRGPDAEGRHVDLESRVGLGHNRLSIIDLSEAGRQPMADADGQLLIVLNGEIYNYLELRSELTGYPFTSRTDTEVVLAAYQRWGEACLDRFVGMFALAIWDCRQQALFAARDRFGVKPLLYTTTPGGGLLFASEIKALHAAGIERRPDPVTWATYLANGLYEHAERTFWQGIQHLPPGHSLHWQDGRTTVRCWYDLAEQTGPDEDHRTETEVVEQYTALLHESVALRFRADVPVAINLSGGLDSSTLLALVHRVKGADSDLRAYTFTTGDDRYDELPWVRQMLDQSNHPLEVCQLRPEQVPALAAAVQHCQDEPFGGLPTLAYAGIFERARANGTVVLLDGQGMDEQWAGYDYYRDHRQGEPTAAAPLVQGTREPPVRPACLDPELRRLAVPFTVPQPFADRLRSLQYRDARYTKIPRALRFNDRISMRCGTELREPFLDHRLFELALRQPADRKIRHGTGKWLLREIAGQLAPAGVVQAPKRALQTPQREWLRGPLRGWADAMISAALTGTCGQWFDRAAVNREWQHFCTGASDNSFYVWQWISLGLLEELATAPVNGQWSCDGHG